MSGEAPRRERYKTRTEAEVAADTDEALRMHHDNYSINQIAAHQGRPPSSVFKDIKRATAKAQELTQDFIQEKLAESLQAIELVEAEALEAWYRSVEDAEKSRVVEKLGEGPKGSESFVQTVEDTIGQYGDPRLLALVLKCQSEKVKLFESLNIKKSKIEMWDKLLTELRKRKPDKNADS